MSLNNFYPAFVYIASITNETFPTVTFTSNCDFTPGEIVSFRVGKQFGMNEINNKRANVISNTSNSIVIDVDSSTWNLFSLANLNQPGTTPPVCVPSSSGVVPFQYNPYMNIQDAFDNRLVTQ